MNIGDADFCTIDYLCEVNEGNCDRDDECRDGLFCGSCPKSMDVSPEVNCCEPKGNSFLYFIP